MKTESFSSNAADLIAIHRWICGPAIAQQIMLRCFRRRPTSDRINESTVLAVLDEMAIVINDDGTCAVGGK
jgi:hypothetical protein